MTTYYPQDDREERISESMGQAASGFQLAFPPIRADEIRALVMQWRQMAEGQSFLMATTFAKCASDLERLLYPRDESSTRRCIAELQAGQETAPLPEPPDLEQLARATADRTANRIEHLARTMSPNDYPLSERERLMRNAAVEEILTALRTVAPPAALGHAGSDKETR